MSRYAYGRGLKMKEIFVTGEAKSGRGSLA